MTTETIIGCSGAAKIEYDKTQSYLHILNHVVGIEVRMVFVHWYRGKVQDHRMVYHHAEFWNQTHPTHTKMAAFLLQ